MEEKKCCYCGEITATKYCSDKCKRLAKNKRERIASAKSRKSRKCRICGKHISIPHKKLHPGNCTDIAREHTYQKKKLKELKPKNIIEKVCAGCGKVFQSRHILNIFCFDEICRKKRANENNRNSRMILIANRKIGVVAPKKIKSKPHQKNVFLNFITMYAQCPRCSIRHDVKALSGSTKWIYCAGCRSAVFSGSYDNGLDYDGFIQAVL
jgi:hypothetical protein